MSSTGAAASAPRRGRDRAFTIEIMSTLSRIGRSLNSGSARAETQQQQQQQQQIVQGDPDVPASDGSCTDSQSFVSESSVEGSHTNLLQLATKPITTAASNGSNGVAAGGGVLLRRKSSIRKEWKRSPSISNSYADEWERMFLSHGEGDLLLYLKELCCGGELRNCRFRSVVWRLALRVLSSDASRWREETQAWRSRYSQLKQQHCIDISKLSQSPDRSQSADLRVHNPLSLDSRSPWYRFFRSEETRHIIYQDVRRTFPEIQYFHAPDVQEKMISTLFCFAHTSPLLYRQGMHEVLAPLLFVLHSDQLAFQHACEMYSVPPPVMDLVGQLLDPAYIEHDAFAMFSQIMRVIEPWYSVTELEPPVGRQAIESQIPFAKPAEERSGNLIVEKLNSIGERILRVHDLELYLHLEKLEVAPHLYGIRWMRLLFGREFPLQDLLVVWDAVFADGYDADFSLVDYIFVAMLISVRSLLLASDFSSAMTYLMRYPQGADVNFIVSLAYHLQAPDVYPKPVLTGYQGLYMQKTRRHGGGRSAHRSSANRYHTVGIDTSSLRAAIQRIGSQESLQLPQQPSAEPVEQSASASALLRIGSFVTGKSHSVAGQQFKQQQLDSHRPSSLIFAFTSGGGGFSRDDSNTDQQQDQQQHSSSTSAASLAGVGGGGARGLAGPEQPLKVLAEPTTSAPATPLDPSGYFPRSHIRYRSRRGTTNNNTINHSSSHSRLSIQSASGVADADDPNFRDFAEITLPDERLARQKQTDSLLAMCRACGDCLQASILVLQASARSSGTAPAEKRRIEQSLSGLKHVHDVLTGKLAFDASTMQQLISDTLNSVSAVKPPMPPPQQQQQQQQHPLNQEAITPTDQETEMTPVPMHRPVFTFADD